LQWLYMYVASVCFKYFICFLDVCCRCVYLYVAYVLYICCECFIRMLHMFSNGFSSVFASISDACFKCFICLQTHIANVHLDVSKVDQVLHILQWHQCWRTAACRRTLAPTSRSAPHPLISSPSPPLPSLLSISPRQFELDLDAKFGGARVGWDAERDVVRYGRRCCVQDAEH
jgi:hypothetical protein